MQFLRAVVFPFAKYALSISLNSSSSSWGGRVFCLLSRPMIRQITPYAAEDVGHSLGSPFGAEVKSGSLNPLRAFTGLVDINNITFHQRSSTLYSYLPDESGR